MPLCTEISYCLIGDRNLDTRNNIFQANTNRVSFLVFVCLSKEKLYLPWFSNEILAYAGMCVPTVFSTSLVREEISS